MATLPRTRSLRRRGVQLGLTAAGVAALLATATVLAALGRYGNRNDPLVRTFLWNRDTTEGISVTYVVANPDYELSRPAGGLRMIVTQSGRLAEHWEIGELAAYYRESGQRRRALVEGPFPWDVSRKDAERTSSVWTLHRLSKREYEIDVLFHKIKDGMPLNEVKTAIGEQEALTFHVTPLPRTRTHDCAVALSGADGRD